MLSDECAGMEAKAPQGAGETSVGIHLYVPDVDKTFEQAKKEGAKATHELKDQFWGDRNGSLVDPFGHRWMVSTHIEDVKPDEMKRRMDEMFKNMPQQKKAG
jgi:PhnB protein